MFLADYHVHSNFSRDSNAELEDIIRSAISKGAHEIAITDHFEVVQKIGPYNTGAYNMRDWPSKFPLRIKPPDLPITKDFSTACKVVEKMNEKYEEKITILLGIEIAQAIANLTAAEELIKTIPFDVVISSLHTLNNDLDLNYIDFSKCDHKVVYEDYLQRVYDQLFCFYNFDIVAHINYVERYIWRDSKTKFDSRIYAEQFREIFKRIVSLGKGIEINTSGLFQGVNDTFPPLWLLKMYRECGGEVLTVGSDSHSASNVTRGIRFGYEMMKIAGFKAVATFRNRELKFIDLD